MKDVLFSTAEFKNNAFTIFDLFPLSSFCRPHIWRVVV